MALVVRWDVINSIFADMDRERKRQRAAFRRALAPSLQAEGLSKAAITRVAHAAFEALHSEGIYISGTGRRPKDEPAPTSPDEAPGE